LWEAIVGLIVGALAKFIMPGKNPGGIFITVLIGRRTASSQGPHSPATRGPSNLTHWINPCYPLY
jgi:hypothetical protein